MKAMKQDMTSKEEQGNETRKLTAMKGNKEGNGTRKEGQQGRQ